MERCFGSTLEDGTQFQNIKNIFIIVDYKVIWAYNVPTQIPPPVSPVSLPLINLPLRHVQLYITFGTVVYGIVTEKVLCVTLYLLPSLPPLFYIECHPPPLLSCSCPSLIPPLPCMLPTENHFGDLYFYCLWENCYSPTLFLYILHMREMILCQSPSF